jgi:hypothetical protein
LLQILYNLICSHTHIWNLGFSYAGYSFTLKREASRVLKYWYISPLLYRHSYYHENLNFTSHTIWLVYLVMAMLILIPFKYGKQEQVYLHQQQREE